MGLKSMVLLGVLMMAVGGVLTYWALSHENPPETVAFIGGGDNDAAAVTFASTTIQAYRTFYRFNAQGLDPQSVADANKYCPRKLTDQQFLPQNALELHINGNGNSAEACLYEHHEETFGNVRVRVEQVGAANATKPDKSPLALSRVDLSVATSWWDRAQPVIGGVLVGLGTALLVGAMIPMVSGSGVQPRRTVR